MAKYGRMHLNNLTGTPAYVSWIVNLIRPYVGDRVLELGAGIGTITGRLIGRRLCYAAAERDPLYLHMLKNRFLRTPNVTVRQLDPEREADYEGLEDSVDTVLCLNVLEYAARPGEIVSTAAGCLRPGGRLVLLAPQGPGIFGSVDETLGHRQRFTQAELLKFIESAGLDVESTHEVNKVSKPIWWFAGRVLRTPKLSKVTLKIFDKTTWLWRFFDHVLPWQGLSVVLVARRESA